MIAITLLAAASLAKLGQPPSIVSKAEALPELVAASRPPELGLRTGTARQQKSRSHGWHLAAHRRARAAISPIARVRAANRLAMHDPVRGNYLGSVQVYPWSEGALYRLYTSPGRVSDVTLEAGERLNSVAAGDTVRWIIGNTESGTGTTRRTHILVKPTFAGLTTNLLIATDRRVYHVDVESIAGPAMATISWTYPESALLALEASSAGKVEEPVATGVQLEALNFSYRISGDAAPWRPLRAFDDGRQVYIEFPASLAQGEAPPLFVRGTSGQTELVNYRVRGRYYVVDRLFDEAELRLGARHQMVVRIVREGRAS